MIKLKCCDICGALDDVDNLISSNVAKNKYQCKEHSFKEFKGIHKLEKEKNEKLKEKYKGLV